MSPELTLHPLLRYSQHDITPGHCTQLLWDLREHPSSSVRHVSDLDRTLPDLELCQHATTPPINSMKIASDLFPEAWFVEANNAHGVAIRDVLEAIYTSFQLPVTYAEWDPLQQKQKDRISRIFDARWRVSSDPPVVHSKGVLRIDYLLHHTLFAGLTLSLENENSCILTLRRPR